jgi:tetratricopeptide (TPR) repeat protein
MRVLGRVPAIRWLAARSSRGRALGLASLLVLLVLIPVAIAQSLRRSVPADFQAATRAFIEGRYDDVGDLTAKLDQRDPSVVALGARALIARGRYDEAERTLRPVAERDPSGEAALELGLLLKMLTRPEAARVLQPVASRAAVSRDAAELARAGRALQALGASREANDAFRNATSLAPQDPAINTAWGELFLEKFNNREALRSFEAALEADAQWAPAMLGAARALADDNPPQALDMARQALKINSSNASAYVFVAARAIDAGQHDQAREAIQRALEINPVSLEAESLLAGLDYVEDKNDEFEARATKVLGIAPRYGEIYRVAGELAARNYRFDEAVVLARRAMALDANDPRTLASLGVHLLRTGDEPGAREVLERSFKTDPFDVVTFNLLQMMDTLDTFVTVNDGDIVLRMHKEEAPVLQDRVLTLAKEALATVGRRYQFQAKGPILIEVFPKHDDFAVRNVGLPGMIGALGACFGRVVTLDSPRARPPGDFQWEATLWHEVAHVITLQMSNQRVPRWLTEGISVYEEKVARPDWARSMEVSFAILLNRDETIKLRDLNAAFTDPRRISLAYYQASLLVEHLVATFGDSGLRQLVRAFADGVDTETAFKTVLKTDFDELQAGFDQKIERDFSELRAAMQAPDVEISKMPLDQLRLLAEKNPRSFPVKVSLGHALRQAGDDDEALRVFEEARALVPIATGEESPNQQIAAIALERKDRTLAIDALERIVQTDFENVAAARRLADLLNEAGVKDPAKLRPVYERIAAVDPFDGQAHAALGRLALDRGDTDTAIREFRAVIALKPVDQAVAYTDLAESYLKSGQRAEARKQTLAALEIAPSYERAQNLLLQLAGDRP